MERMKSNTLWGLLVLGVCFGCSRLQKADKYGKIPSLYV